MHHTAAATRGTSAPGCWPCSSCSGGTSLLLRRSLAPLRAGLLTAPCSSTVRPRAVVSEAPEQAPVSSNGWHAPEPAAAAGQAESTAVVEELRTMRQQMSQLIALLASTQQHNTQLEGQMQQLKQQVASIQQGPTAGEASATTAAPAASPSGNGNGQPAAERNHAVPAPVPNSAAGDAAAVSQSATESLQPDSSGATPKTAPIVQDVQEAEVQQPQLQTPAAQVSAVSAEEAPTATAPSSTGAEQSPAKSGAAEPSPVLHSNESRAASTSTRAQTGVADAQQATSVPRAASKAAKASPARRTKAALAADRSSEGNAGQAAAATKPAQAGNAAATSKAPRASPAAKTAPAARAAAPAAKAVPASKRSATQKPQQQRAPAGAKEAPAPNELAAMAEQLQTLQRMTQQLQQVLLARKAADNTGSATSSTDEVTSVISATAAAASAVLDAQPAQAVADEPETTNSPSPNVAAAELPAVAASVPVTLAAGTAMAPAAASQPSTSSAAAAHDAAAEVAPETAATTSNSSSSSSAQRHAALVSPESLPRPASVARLSQPLLRPHPTRGTDNEPVTSTGRTQKGAVAGATAAVSSPEDTAAGTAAPASEQAADARSSSTGSGTATSSGRPSSRSTSDSRSEDALSQRIAGTTSWRQLQQLYERQAGRLRPHHIAAIVARLPATNEGRAIATGIRRSAGMPTADAGDGSTGASGQLQSFGCDLLMVLQLQLGQLPAGLLAGCIQASAALALAPRAVWLERWLAASQGRLTQMTPNQLATCAAALADLGATPWAAWLQAYEAHTGRLLADKRMDCGAAASAALALARLGHRPSDAWLGALLATALAVALSAGGSKAQAALQDGEQQRQEKPEQQDEQQQKQQVASAQQGQQEVSQDKIQPAPALTTAAASPPIAAAPTFSATAAGDLIWALHQFDYKFESEEVQRVALLAIARTGAGLAWSGFYACSAPGLARLLAGLAAWDVDPGAEWLAAFAVAVRPKLLLFGPGDIMCTLRALRHWRAGSGSSSSSSGTDAAFAGALLEAVAVRCNGHSLSDLCEALMAAADLGFAPFQQQQQQQGRQGEQGPEEGVQTLLAELAHRGLTDLTNEQLLGALKASAVMGVVPRSAFVAALMRELRGRLGQLAPGDFAACARCLASCGVSLERDILDGYFGELEKRLEELNDADFPVLLGALGALKQRPASQLMGTFLAAALQRVPAFDAAELVGCLGAMAALQLSREDTQGVRATTAAGTPTPSEVVEALLTTLLPLLPELPATQLSAALEAVGRLGPQLKQESDDASSSSAHATWVEAAMAGVAVKLEDADAQVILGVLSALSSLGTAPSPALASALPAALCSRLDGLSPRELSLALTHLASLGLAPDEQLMGSFLDRAAAAVTAPDAAAADAADVLHAMAAATSPAGASAQGLPPPPSVWLASYTAATARLLPKADAASLSRMAWALARLRHLPGAAWLSTFSSAAAAKLGSHYMDASRYKAPAGQRPTLFDLPQLADTVWALAKLGAPTQRDLTNLLLSKSHDRLSALSPGQLAGAMWALTRAGTHLPPKWLAQFGTAAAPVLGQLSAEELADVIWALGVQHGGAGETDASSSLQKGAAGGSAGGPGTSAGAAGGVAASAPSPALLRALAGALNVRLSELGRADVGAGVALMARHGQAPSARVMQAYCDALAADWAGVSDEQLAGAAAAVGALRADPGQDWLDGFVAEAHNRMAQLQQGQRCRIVWALARLHHNPGAAWVDAFTAAALEGGDAAAAAPNSRVAATAAGDLADALWALSELGYQIQPQWLQRLHARLTRSVAALSSGQLQRTVQLLAAAGSGGDGVAVVALPAALGDELGRCVSAKLGSGGSGSGVLGDVSEAVSVAWACAKLGLRLQGPFRDALIRRWYGQLPSLPPADLTRGFWAASRLGAQLLKPQLAEVDRLSLQHLGTALTGDDVARLREAFKHYGHTPSAEWQSALAQQPAAERLASLSVAEMLQLAGAGTSTSTPSATASTAAAADSNVSAAVPDWVREWVASGALNAGVVMALAPQQLVQLFTLLARLNSSSGSSSSASGGSDAQQVELLGLLCLRAQAVLEQLSAQQLCDVVLALGQLRAQPPNSQLLHDIAARLSDKAAALGAGHAVTLLTAFGELGFAPGEPLLPKLTSKLLSAITSTTASSNSSTAPLHPTAASRLLASLLLVSDQPDKELTKALTLGLGPRLRDLAGADLVALLGAFAARGMVPPGEWAASYMAAMARQLGSLTAQQLSDVAGYLQALRMEATEQLAVALVQETRLRMEAAQALDSSSTNQASVADGAPAQATGGAVLSMDALAGVASYLSASGFKPEEAWTNTYKATLAVKLPSLDGAQLARALVPLTAFKVTLPTTIMSTIKAHSRRCLVSADVSAIAQLLLVLCDMRATPDEPWLLDACAVAAPQLATAPPADVAALAAALAAAGRKGAPTDSWMVGLEECVQQRLEEWDAAALATLGQALHRARWQPAPGWLAVVEARLRGLMAGSNARGGDAASSRVAGEAAAQQALAWYAALTSRAS